MTADRRRKEPLSVPRPGETPAPRTGGFLSNALAAAGAPRNAQAPDLKDDDEFDSAPEGEVSTSLARQRPSSGGLAGFLAQVTGHSDFRAAPPPAAVIPAPANPELTAPAPVVVVVAPPDEESPSE